MEAFSQPYLGLVLIVRDAAKTIDALLESVLQAKLKSGAKVPAFTEYVFVDTGSKDDTRERIVAAIKKVFPRATFGWDDAFVVDHPTEGLVKITLTNFGWIDDFAAARNYAFSLATAKWRMWLDADDVLENAQNLLPTLQDTERTSPQSNVIMMPYDYAPNETIQWKDRIFRWADGWFWDGEIHEYVKPTVTHGKAMTQFPDIIVRHRPGDGHGEKSLARNMELCSRVFGKAEDKGDTYRMGLMSFYLGTYAKVWNKRDEALEHLERAANYLRASNLACLSLTEAAKIHLERENFRLALDTAGRAISHAPELPDGWGALGAALIESGQTDRAIQVFESMRALSPHTLFSTRDVVWNDGLVPCYAAKAYIAKRDIEKATEQLQKVPDNVALHERVWMHYSRAASDNFKLMGTRYLQQLVEYLVWNNEPVKALEVIRAAAPSNIASDPVLSVWEKTIWDKMQQMKSWPDYVRTYAAETNEVFDRKEDQLQVIRDQGRAKLALEAAKRLPKEGEPYRIYCVGLHGGWIEQDMMEANPRIHLTACDVNPNANTAIARLMEKFPGRVKFHTVRSHHYDWIPEGEEESFDAVLCFEVIEHVPDDQELMRTIWKLLKPGGKLYLSTPIAEYWVAPDATKRHHWHQHVRAYQPEQLWQLVRYAGFEGDIYATDNRVLHFCDLTKWPWPKRPTHEVMKLSPSYTERPEVTIWCPSTPKGFDPKSPAEGHTGGSEEAVINLARELWQLGMTVTVYVDKKPDRHFQPHVVDSVLWMDASKLDPQRITGSVFVWRSPMHAAWLKDQNPKLRVLNWLHDVLYGQPPEVYAKADGTIVVSNFHAMAIEKNDGFKGPFLVGANGINPEDFDDAGPLAGITRDPHKAIYASAPNRGLLVLLEEWPRIRAAIPDATLDVYYGWEITEKMMRENPRLDLELGPLLRKLRGLFDYLEDQGVTFHGGVSHAELHKAYRRAGVWAYPCHSQTFEETYCIAAVKAQAAGTTPVTLSSGALPEVFMGGAMIDDRREDWREAWVNAVISAMKLAPSEAERKGMREMAACLSWTEAAKRFKTFALDRPPAITFIAQRFRAFDNFDMNLPSGERQLGGSEEAVCILSDALSQLGADVTVLTAKHSEHRTPDGTKWTWHRDRALGQAESVIVWRDPKCAAEMKELHPEKTVINWLMDPTHVEATGVDLDTADGSIILTEAHALTLPPIGAFDVVPLALDLSELPPMSLQNDKGRHMDWVMWSVSPDRGLVNLLRMWPRVKASVPSAQLHIYYGIEGVMQAAQADRQYAEEVHADEMKALLDGFLADPASGVHYHGGVTRTELMAQHVRCGTWVYPGSNFPETFCMSGLKAVACGLQALYVPVGALPEVLPREGQVKEDFGARLIEALKYPLPFTQRKALADAARERYDSRKVARKFLQTVEEIRRNAAEEGPLPFTRWVSVGSPVFQPEEATSQPEVER